MEINQRLYDSASASTDSKSKAGKVLTTGAQKVGSAWQDFKSFINKGNVFDLATAVILGASFSAIVTSFTEDLLSPIIGLLFDKNLSHFYLPIRCASLPQGIKCSDISAVLVAYPTTELANAAGIVTFNIGNFMEKVLRFFITASFLYFLFKTYAVAFRKKPKPKTKECEFCCMDIPIRARRCPSCTTVLQSMEDDGDRPFFDSPTSPKGDVKVRF